MNIIVSLEEEEEETFDSAVCALSEILSYIMKINELNSEPYNIWRKNFRNEKQISI